MPQEKSCQTQFLWGVILGNMFQVKRPLLQFKNTFEWIIFMVYLMLFKVTQNDTLTLSGANWFERTLIWNYACHLFECVI